MPRQHRSLSPGALQVRQYRRRNLVRMCLWIIAVGALASLIIGFVIYALSIPHPR
jgi:hypothetical protein